MVQIEYVELGLFVTVVSGLVTLILGGFWIIISKMMVVKERVATVENQNGTDTKNIDGLWDKVHEMNDQRGKDVLQFTEVVGKLNVTLGKMEGTLERMDKRLERLEGIDDDSRNR